MYIFVLCFCLFFFFKQKTAYEMLRSLVGSEMCIRDRCCATALWDAVETARQDRLCFKRWYIRFGSTPSAMRVQLRRNFPGGSCWEDLGDTIRSRYGHTCTVGWDNKLYVIGGNDYGRALSETCVFDSETGKWNQAAPVPTALTNHSSLLVDDKLYVIGGKNARGVALDSVFVFDMQTRSWSEAPRMNSAKGRTVSTTLRGKIYVFTDESVADVFDIRRNTWTTIQRSTAPPQAYEGARADQHWVAELPSEYWLARNNCVTLHDDLNCNGPIFPNLLELEF
eukprot:TRINITY_DN11605_c0_g1_i1.p1 TRINITY_DN11605_c0_g1~~TRINITY_DN11605_c0_g1_i1.p1  ORF type:complete len:281 (-),score=48.40 TRINITY_DN11605_c0_g1_i1:235-1077(-)